MRTANTLSSIDNTNMNDDKDKTSSQNKPHVHQTLERDQLIYHSTARYRLVGSNIPLIMFHFRQTNITSQTWPTGS